MKKNILLFLALFAFLAFSLKIVHRKLAEIKEPASIDPTEQIYLSKKALELKERIATKQNFCENTYLPIIPGASWKYDFSFGDTKHSLEIDIPVSEDDSRKINIYYPEEDKSFQSKMFCSSEGITVDNLFFLALPEKMPEKIEIKSSNGFFIPKNLDKITSWNFELETLLLEEKTNPESQITEEDSDEEKLLNKKIKIFFDTLGEEDLETPFGKIKTRHIESWWIIEEDFPENNEKLKVTTATCNFWLADQTGIIKSIYEEKSSPPLILELRSFQIPANQ
jgi:hypothetical protein